MIMENLVNYIKRYVEIEEQELDIILSSFQERFVSKDRFVIQKGQVVTDYYFVSTGGLLIYVLENDIQSTRYLTFENELIVDIENIKSKGTSRTYIRAIEDTVLYTISHEKMEALYEQFPIWQKFGRLLWEEAFASVLSSHHSFQSLTAKERYLILLKRSGLVNRVALKDLSSFLGITPSSLSRIRKEIL